MRLSKVHGHRLISQRELQFAAIHAKEPVFHLTLGAIGVHEHRRVIRTKSEVILIVMLLQIGEKLHRFKEITAIGKLEGDVPSAVELVGGDLLGW